MDYEFIKKLIEENSDDVCEFAPFGEGTSDMWIQKAEERLGVKFPPSYVWWLKNYGGGEVNGEEIFSIYESDFNTNFRPTGGIIYKNEFDQKKFFSTKNQLIIHTNNQGERYYFDLRQIDKNGEYPIYVDVGFPIIYSIKYADNFLEFLQKKIQE